MTYSFCYLKQCACSLATLNKSSFQMVSGLEPRMCDHTFSLSNCCAIIFKYVNHRPSISHKFHILSPSCLWSCTNQSPPAGHKFLSSSPQPTLTLCTHSSPNPIPNSKLILEVKQCLSRCTNNSHSVTT
jgi:hypothetical protein